MTVLAAIRGVNQCVHFGVSINEGNIFLNTASPDPAFVAYLSATEPGAGASISASDVKVATETHNPNRYRVSQCAVALD